MLGLSRSLLDTSVSGSVSTIGHGHLAVEADVMETARLISKVRWHYGGACDTIDTNMTAYWLLLNLLE